MSKPCLPILSLLLAVLLISCDMILPAKQQTVPLASPQEILEADRAFSERSEEIGMRRAYYEYMAEEGVLLRPQTMPLRGAEAIDYLSLVDDSTYTLTWVPRDARIAASGDMGFSYGTYLLTGNGEIYEGTYVNVWQKENGTWKFVLNAGNAGISPNP